MKFSLANQSPEQWNTETLSYFLYLSRNNAWLNIDGEPHTLRITAEDRILSDTEVIHVPVTSTDHENVLKFLLAQKLRFINIGSAITTRRKQTLLFQQSLFTQNQFFYKETVELCLNKIRYPRIDFVLNSKPSVMGYTLYIESMDVAVEKQLKSLTDKVTYRTLLRTVKPNKKIALEDAVKNALWLAIQSGDHEHLSLLLETDHNKLLYQTYNNKNIFQALFDSEPGKEQPFKSKEPDHSKCLELLLNKAAFDVNKVLPNSNGLSTLEIIQQMTKAGSNERARTLQQIINTHCQEFNSSTTRMLSPNR